MSASVDLLPVVITIIGVGVALAAFNLTVVLVFFRILNQRIQESEERTTQRIIESEERTTQRIIESEERVTRLIFESETRLTRLIGETEVRLSARIDGNGQRIDNLEVRMQRIEQETAEIKGALNVIQNALALRIGE